MGNWFLCAFIKMNRKNKSCLINIESRIKAINIYLPIIDAKSVSCLASSNIFIWSYFQVQHLWPSWLAGLGSYLPRMHGSKFTPALRHTESVSMNVSWFYCRRYISYSISASLKACLHANWKCLLEVKVVI